MRASRTNSKAAERGGTYSLTPLGACILALAIKSDPSKLSDMDYFSFRWQ
ncbi:unannotated protein [freshwater metagenome]|uniref:Unannotated protein n=1 Tax=freshwater metagenome TaxID=449393 RepID=A0A6J7TFS0_9ZZZZ